MISLANQLAKHFNRNELFDLVNRAGFDDPDMLTSDRYPVSRNAQEIEKYAVRRSAVYTLLKTIREMRGQIDLRPYLYLVVNQEKGRFTNDEIRQWYIALCANPDGTYMESERENQIREVQRKMMDNGQYEQFYEQVAEKIPEIKNLEYFSTGARVVERPRHVSEPKRPKNQSEVTDYVNFDIRIDPVRGDGTYPVTASTSTGGKTESISYQTLPVDDPAYQDAITLLPAMLAGEDHVMQLGSLLHNFLFPKEVNDLYNRFKALNNDRVRIRINMVAESKELHQIPWEYCRDDWQFIATLEKSPLVRYIPVSQEEQRMNAPKPIRILVAMASPKKMSKLDLDGEEARIRKALKSLEESGMAELEVLRPATPLSLLDAFEDFQPHIFHFVGHGGQNEQGEGALVVENGDAPSFIDAEDMMGLVQNSGHTRLVILSACETTDIGQVKPGMEKKAGFLGVGPRLVKAGVPAVIAMQTVVPEQSAYAFTQALYRSLAKGDTLDTAVTKARFRIYFVDKVFWGIPVLFMRTPDGKLWE